jgi:hypothetical protein
LETYRIGASPGLDEGVDTHLKVLGVDGLRVVDASVKPVLIGGNINAAVIMIVENLPARTTLRRSDCSRRLCKLRLGKNDYLIGTVGFSATVTASHGFTQIFSGYGAAQIPTGALEATWMIGNAVFATIPPSTVQ